MLRPNAVFHSACNLVINWTEAAEEKTWAVGLCRLTPVPTSYPNGVMKRQSPSAQGRSDALVNFMLPIIVSFTYLPNTEIADLAKQLT